MNNKQLADYVEYHSNLYYYTCIKEMVSRFRQLDAENEALKAKLKLNDETLKPMLIENIKSNTQKSQQEMFFARYDSVRGEQEK